MNPCSFLLPYHQLFLHHLYIIITIISILLIIPTHHAQEFNKNYYSTCRKNTTLICGQTTLEMYPFWGGNRPSYCGLKEFELVCVNDFPTISLGTGPALRVVEINPPSSRLLLRYYGYDLEDRCPRGIFDSIKPNHDFFSYGMGTVDLFVYFCYDKYLPVLFGVRNNFTCFEYATNQYVFGIELLLQNYAATLDSECRIQSQTPVERMVVEKFANDAKMLPGELLKPSFEVYYVFYRTACSKCEKSGGLCWGNTNFGVEYTQCLYEPSGSNLILKIGIGGGVAVISILFLVLLFFIFYHRMKNRRTYPKDVEACIKKYGSSLPKRFRYSALKKITNSFKEELGKGGYGNVYKGKLSDGCVVAVKVLIATKGNGEDLMNEIASIGRTSHVNVVSLLGFVYEGKRRALIYEYMPNGSLEKFIHGTTPSLKGQNLSWEKLYSIALGIARGLEYLHCGF